MDKKSFFYGALSGVMAALLIVLGILGIKLFADYVNLNNNPLSANETTSPELEDKIEEINKMLNLHYYETYDQEKLDNAALEGYVKGVGDPYTNYYTAEDYKRLIEGYEGSYEGIGVVIGYSEKGDYVQVVAPFEDSPGAEAGILPEDYIVAVDGESIIGFKLEEAVALIRGEKGTEVVLSIVREGEELDITVVRNVIKTQSITYEMLDNSIGYIKVTGFKETTYDQFMEALKTLEREEQKGLIIDLRNNPGGLLDSVHQISDELLPEGLVVYTEDKYGKRKTYETDEAHQFNKPLVILINENSASASEILSGAVKDHKRGTLVGKTTFGKGLVQVTIPLQDGAMNVTIARYFTPSGNYIHKKGVEPDIVVELPETVKNPYYLEREDDLQLDKAIEVLEQQIK